MTKVSSLYLFSCFLPSKIALSKAQFEIPAAAIFEWCSKLYVHIVLLYRLDIAKPQTVLEVEEIDSQYSQLDLFPEVGEGEFVMADTLNEGEAMEEPMEVVLSQAQVYPEWWLTFSGWAI